MFMNPNLFFGHLLGHDNDAFVALDSASQSQTNTSVSRSGLDDVVAWFQVASLLGLLNHSHSDTVLDTATSVQVLALGV